MKMNKQANDKLKQLNNKKILNILNKIANIYKIGNLEILDIIINYDTYDLLIGDTSLKYKIEIDQDSNNIVVIDYLNKLSDYYQLTNNLVFLKRIYKKDLTKIIYDPRNIRKKEEFSNQINFTNNNLKTVISYTLKNQDLEELLLFDLLNNKITNIYTLYKIINNYLPSYVNITNYHICYQENIKVLNQELIKCYIKIDTDKYLKYQDKELFIITKNDPQTDQEFIKLKTKLKTK